MTKRLFRSRQNRVIAGVCGGLADYFGIDPVIVRLAMLAAVFFWSAGIWIYIAACIFVPEQEL